MALSVAINLGIIIVNGTRADLEKCIFFCRTAVAPVDETQEKSRMATNEDGEEEEEEKEEAEHERKEEDASDDKEEEARPPPFLFPERKRL